MPAPIGTYVAVRIAGPSGSVWRLVRSRDRWLLTSDALEGPAARLTIPEAVAWRIFTKGLSPQDATAVSHIDGDRGLAEPALVVVAIVG